MTSLLEKGGGTFAGIKMLLCENPLPPLAEAIAAAQDELAKSNYYTEAYSAPLRRLLSDQLNVPERATVGIVWIHDRHERCARWNGEFRQIKRELFLGREMCLAIRVSNFREQHGLA
jgi:hypothetical protein